MVVGPLAYLDTCLQQALVIITLSDEFSIVRSNCHDYFFFLFFLLRLRFAWNAHRPRPSASYNAPPGLHVHSCNTFCQRGTDTWYTAVSLWQYAIIHAKVDWYPESIKRISNQEPSAFRKLQRTTRSACTFLQYILEMWY